MFKGALRFHCYAQCSNVRCSLNALPWQNDSVWRIRVFQMRVRLHCIALQLGIRLCHFARTQSERRAARRDRASVLRGLDPPLKRRCACVLHCHTRPLSLKNVSMSSLCLRVRDRVARRRINKPRLNAKRSDADITPVYRCYKMVCT